MNRVEIIQKLIDKIGATSYLELGVRNGDCFNAINCETKVGVDPDTGSAATDKVDSDTFFRDLANRTVEQNFGVIFIDGAHLSEQVSRDIENALAFLAEGGFIVMHDCLPPFKFAQEVPQLPEHDEWCGDVWKSFVKARQEKDGVEFFVVDCDYGCGVLKKGTQEKLNLEGQELTYENFVKNKEVWMNVRSTEWFSEVYLKN